MKKRAFVACVAAVASSAILPVLGVDTYDHRVQYLESSGTQYIDTGIIPSWDTMFTATYEYLSTVQGSGGWDMIAGVRTTGDGSTRYYPVSLNGGLLKERYVFSSTQKSTNHLARLRHTIAFNDANHHVILDGVDLGALSAQLSAASRTCWLFGGNSEGNDHWFSASRIYECALITNGVPARTFIPVVDENGVACMFDEVERKLYRNQGTGAFTPGPRMDGGDEETSRPYWYQVEYLEATGTQWLDTGLLATSNTQTDVGYQYTEATQTWGAMIGGVQSPSRYYPISLNAEDARKERYVYGGNQPAVNYPALLRHEVSFNDTARVVSVDGAALSTFDAGFTTSTTPMYIFAASKANRAADWMSKSRIWHYDIYEKGMLMRKFIPVVDTNGVACLHDLISGTNHYNRGTGTFKVGRIVSSKVPLDLSARTDLAPGMNVLPFEVRPSYGTVFTLDETTAATYAAEVRADGVYLVAKESAGDAARVIDVTGSTDVQFKVSEMPACASIRFSGIVTLTADCDWRGLGTIVVPADVIIDLHGHDLRVAGFTAEPGAEAVFTDSTSSGGRLRVEVADGGVLRSDSVVLTGSLKLFKEGPGTFIAVRPDQAYSGGTEVAAGALRLAPPDGGYRGTIGPETSTVTVDEGAEFDIGGNYTMSFNHVLAGGTLTTSRNSRGNNRQVTSLTLTADSVVSNKNFGLVGPGFGEVKVRMNGHALRTDFISGSGNYFYICHSTFEDEGTIQIGSSWFLTHNSDYHSIGRNLTVEFPSAGRGGLDLSAPFTVSNFISRVGSFRGSCALTVLGTFTPLVYGRTAFPNMVMADGSTLDLSGMDDVPTLNVVSTDKHTLSFATNATIKVKLGDRTVSGSTPIVGWTAATKPGNLDTLKFVCGDEGQNYALMKADDGLYVVKGMTIIIR